MNATKSQQKLKNFFADLGTAVLAGALVAVGLHYFANFNDFYPGGISGIAFVLSDLIHISKSLLLLAFNLPLFAAMSVFVDRKLGVYLSIYLLAQSLMFEVLEAVSFPYYETHTNLIFAAIGAGVVSGAGYALMLRHFGASGGTYAISALIKRAHPAANAAWLAFAMDSAVVAVVFVVYGCRIEPALCTLINLFIANTVVDEAIKGVKTGYRFEIVTDHAEELAQEIMSRSRHGVTMVEGEGMYTRSGRKILICIVRKRHVSEMIRLLRSYPDTFTSFTKVNEVFGRFHK
ncbi:MAG: YitT family protein [Oscillospiraceae bacterium]|nr:YitT family protein [Oscillospiraceae bacterium]